MANFFSGDFAVQEAPASLKRSIEVILHCLLHIEMKQSYFEILELVPAVSAKLSWNFIRHLAAAVPLLKTGNDISPICRYIIEVWLVLMAYLPYIWQIWYGIIMICRHMQKIWRNMHDTIYICIMYPVICPSMQIKCCKLEYDAIICKL